MLFTVVLLLVIYLVGTVEINSVHAIFHQTDNQSELHSAVNESNGCHQWVYHNNKNQDCEHKAHLVANKNCPLCHLSLQSFHYACIKPADYFSISIELPNGDVYAAAIGEIFSLLPGRAPPIA